MADPRPGTKYYAELFKHNGASYHRAMQLYPQARDAEFENALSFLNLKAGDTVLDVPAGGGYLYTYLPEDINYLGFDFSGGFAAVDESVVHCSETDIALDDHSVDHIVCLAALHHVQDRVGFFRECRRILKPSGVLLVGDVVAGSKPAQFLNGFVNQWNALGHDGDFIESGREIAELSSAGFAGQFEQRSYDWVFASMAGAEQYFRLLFTLNNNPPSGDLLTQIDNLGVKKTSAQISVRWSLGFIKAINPPA